jgi:hypothetical protein
MTIEAITTTPEQAKADLWRDRIGAAFRAGSAERQRGPHDLGISALGACTRKAAYAVARVDPSDEVTPREARQANLGTAEHEWLLPRLAALIPGARHEVTVELHAAGLTIPGHVDLSAPGDVVDLKTVGEHRLQGVRRTGHAYLDHTIQEAGYATALLQAGSPPEDLVTLYLDRASGDVEVIVEPFTNDHVLLVVDRVSDLVDWADNPDDAPREDIDGQTMRGPGRRGSFACNECPFLRRCWGPLARPDDDGSVDFTPSDDSDVIRTIAEYERGRDMERDGKRIKEEAARILDNVKFGMYGEYEYGRTRPVEQVDNAAAVALLRALGYEVPKTTRQGSLKVRRITARPAPKTRRSRPAKADDE